MKVRLLVEMQFEHAVGDFVMTAWDFQTRKPNGERRDRDAWQVIERIYNEHCGGFRVQYVCRSQSIFGNREKTHLFDPCEIVPMPLDMRPENT